MTRLRGRSPVGARLFGTAPFGKWQTQTFIAGLTCADLIAPWVIKVAMDRTAFDAYIETQLAPTLDPGTVVILDNLATHKSPKAAEILKACGCWLLYLPPTPLISIPSKWHSSNSRPTSGGSRPEPSINSSRHSATSAPSSTAMSAGTSSRLPAMPQIMQNALNERLGRHKCATGQILAAG